MRSDYYDHIILIPLISAYLFFSKRKKIFSSLNYGFKTGIPVIAIGFALYFLGRQLELKLNQNDYTSLIVCSALFIFIGSFICCYGSEAFSAAAFPLIILVFMIPIPTFIMDRFIYILLLGSTELTDLFFNLTGTAYVREGFVFHLPGLSIEVAKVCSGIRSSIALVIVTILASHLFLQTGWKKLVLLVAVFPITILKNGIRIVTITLLAVYVDKKFLTQGFLHQSGGILFFIPSLVLLGLILWLLKRTDQKQVAKAEGEL
jgi:exosortase